MIRYKFLWFWAMFEPTPTSPYISLLVNLFCDLGKIMTRYDFLEGFNQLQLDLHVGFWSTFHVNSDKTYGLMWILSVPDNVRFALAFQQTVILGARNEPNSTFTGNGYTR